MSTPKSSSISSTGTNTRALRPPLLAWSLLALLVGLAAAWITFLLGGSALGATIARAADGLFAASSVQLWWYVTRSAGIISYLLLWLSTVWGLAVASKIVDRLLPRLFTFDFHQTLSLLAIGFLLLHIAVLTLDRYLPFSYAQILIPFIAPYRPFWVGIGSVAFYLTLLVTVTFYLRKRIGMKAFRVIHVLSLAGYLGATLHGMYAGTDAALLSMQLVYQGTLLAVVFLTVYWLVSQYLYVYLPGRQAG